MSALECGHIEQVYVDGGAEMPLLCATCSPHDVIDVSGLWLRHLGSQGPVRDVRFWRVKFVFLEGVVPCAGGATSFFLWKESR